MVKKPVRRRISPQARAHINQAREWRAAERRKLQGARAQARGFTLHIRRTLRGIGESIKGGKDPRKVRRELRDINQGNEKVISGIGKKVRGARTAREEARLHIGAAKETVEKQNPHPSARRGRLHRKEFY